jgi:hypothetical protein
MVQPGPSRFDKVDGEELDDEKVIVRSAHIASEVVVL